jgi:hypothetical protein
LVIAAARGYAASYDLPLVVADALLDAEALALESDAHRAYERFSASVLARRSSRTSP